MSTEKESIDLQYVATARSDEAEEALLREYHYHLLRAAELRIMLEHCGYNLEG